MECNQCLVLDYVGEEGEEVKKNMEEDMVGPLKGTRLPYYQKRPKFLHALSGFFSSFILQVAGENTKQ